MEESSSRVAVRDLASHSKMTPWTKEWRMQEVVTWMFNENPDIWYVPAALTKANKAGQVINLTFSDATEIFQEMERRGFLEPHNVQISWKDPSGIVQTETIQAWMLDRSATSDVHEFIHRGSQRLFWSSLRRFFWDDEDKRWGYIIVIGGTFVGGFFSEAGKAAFSWIKSWFQ